MLNVEWKTKRGWEKEETILAWGGETEQIRQLLCCGWAL